MVGNWRVNSGGSSCDMFLTLTNVRAHPHNPRAFRAAIQTEDDLADLMNQHFGARITGDEIRAMHHDGYSSHFLDMM